MNARGTVRVLPVAPAEWSRLREIRLLALAEAPKAFGTTLQEASAYPDSEWQRRATPAATGQMWSARGDAGWVGMVGAVLESEGTVQLVAMWVAPEWRGQGVARQLIEAVIGWYRGRPGSHLWLRVGVDNVAARRCYEKMGFVAAEPGWPRAFDPGPRRLLHMRFQDPSRNVRA